jgi:hypothetical protein
VVRYDFGKSAIMGWLTKLLIGTGKAASKPTPRGRRLPSPQARQAAGPAGALSIPGGAGYPRAVVGESRCQEALSAICGGHNREGHELEPIAQLVPEPQNPFDPNAVMVMIQGQKVGYLMRDDAPRYLKALAAIGRHGDIASVRAKIVGGWRTNQHDAGHFGVKLALPWPVRFE